MMDLKQVAEPESRLVVYLDNASHQTSTHERETGLEIARMVAEILECDYAGEFDIARSYPGALYFVPGDTLIAGDPVHQLGFHGDQDLFGGVVPHPFVATKVITHPLIDEGAPAPAGWSHAFAQQTADVVLPGFSAFSLLDAHRAGIRLLQENTVRVKQACGIGGLGQWVVATPEELDTLLESMSSEQVARDGLVLEWNLAELETHSVGRVHIGEMLATYYGTQQLTTNNAGEQVYGGSRLLVARGDFDALLRLNLGMAAEKAVEQARVYHAAAMSSFPGMFASRCNYDIAQGTDDCGRLHSGVLEQSWRIGGASGAELAALAAFRADPALSSICASTTELYGDNPVIPDGAHIYFCGTDEKVGPMTKYARIEPDANP